jgi:hypothetical protein
MIARIQVAIVRESESSIDRKSRKRAHPDLLIDQIFKRHVAKLFSPGNDLFMYWLDSSL